MTNKTGILDVTKRSLAAKVAIGALCFATVAGQTAPAWAGIDNTVTVNATTPSGGTLAPTASESVDLADPTPTLTLDKAHTLTRGGLPVSGDAQLGDVINYTYVVTNTGNVSIENVDITDTHDIPLGTASLAVMEPAAGNN